MATTVRTGSPDDEIIIFIHSHFDECDGDGGFELIHTVRRDGSGETTLAEVFDLRRELRSRCLVPRPDKGSSSPTSHGCIRPIRT